MGALAFVLFLANIALFLLWLGARSGTRAALDRANYEQHRAESLLANAHGLGAHAQEAVNAAQAAMQMSNDADARFQSAARTCEEQQVRLEWQHRMLDSFMRHCSARGIGAPPDLPPDPFAGYQQRW